MITPIGPREAEKYFARTRNVTGLAYHTTFLQGTDSFSRQKESRFEKIKSIVLPVLKWGGFGLAGLLIPGGWGMVLAPLAAVALTAVSQIRAGKKLDHEHMVGNAVKAFALAAIGFGIAWATTPAVPVTPVYIYPPDYFFGG